MSADPIHPKHYADLKPEPIEVIESWGLGFHLGNSVKYIARAGKKLSTSAVEDLKKARWYLDREIARLINSDDVHNTFLADYTMPAWSEPLVGPIEIPAGQLKSVTLLAPDGGVVSRHSLTEITGETSDGYHTFNELYDHRITLFLALCNEVHRRGCVVWRSKLHSDGSKIDGWFIMGIGITPGTQITYHLPLDRWDESGFLGFEEVRAPEFDGHTSKDVLRRLKHFYATIKLPRTARCPACTADPSREPRGPSACFDCRELTNKEAR